MTDKEKWLEVMNLAKKYGFVVFSHSGVALLATKEEQEKIRKDNQS